MTTNIPFPTTTPLLSLTSELSDSVLACPRCGDYWTHLDAVEVHSASGQALRVEASGEDSGSSITATPISSSDDGRRHTVVFTIYCETGGHTSRIEFRQHKGLTVVTRSVEEREDDIEDDIESAS